MREQFVPALRCPTCGGEGTLELHADAVDDWETREGSLRCRSCGSEFAVHRGVAELLANRPAAAAPADGAGFERLAEYLQLAGREAEFFRELPDLPDEHWHVRSRSMHQLLTTIPFRPGERVLDVGAGTCWAAYHLAARALDVVALDVVTPELRGLYTADLLMRDRRTYFERVLGSMDELPLVSSSVDYVFSFETLHAADDAALRRTMAEFFRVLRPGGRVIMLNERVVALRDRDELPHEGRGHAHSALRYRWEAARAGFFTDTVEPHHVSYFGDADLTLPPGTPPLTGLAEGVGFALRGSGVARRVYLEWLNDVAGGVGFNMIATKPWHFVGRHEPLSPPDRLLRTVAAGTRLQLARLRGRGVPRAPRTPEQVHDALQARAQRVDAAAGPATPEPSVNGATAVTEAPANGRPSAGPHAAPRGAAGDAQTIVFTGNCQTQGIADAVRAILPGTDTPAFHMWGMDHPDAHIRLDVIREAVARADVWVRMPLGTNVLLEEVARPQTRVIEIPSLTFAAFHPDIVMAVTTMGTYFRGLADYHSAIALWAWRRGLDPAEAAALFQPEVMAALGYDRYWAPAVQAVRDEFAGSDLSWGPFWARLKREGVFMHTINHPCLAAVALQGKAVAACLTGRDSIWDEPVERYADDHLREVVWPVYPYVGQALGVTGSYHWRYGDTHFADITSWAEATWSRYEGTPPEAVVCDRLQGAAYDAVLEPRLLELTRTPVRSA